MSFERGDIVFLYFDLPKQRETKTHPAIIISNNNVHDTDELYICVMITNSGNEDIFSFPLEGSMFDNKLNIITGEARCHLITYVMEKHIDSKFAVNKLKEATVNRLVEHINMVSICEDE